MNLSTLATLLQLTATMLSGLSTNKTVSPAAMQTAIAMGSRTVQLSAQVIAMPNIPFPIPQNDSNAPNIKDLGQTAYLDANGNYVQLGSTVDLIQEDTSFGDMNADGLDDAAAIVERTDGAGDTMYSLAAMLNQDGIMFNIADANLGQNVQIFSHNVVQGGDVILNMSVDNAPAATTTYYLLGDQLMKI